MLEPPAGRVAHYLTFDFFHIISCGYSELNTLNSLYFAASSIPGIDVRHALLKRCLFLSLALPQAGFTGRCSDALHLLQRI